MFQTWYYKYYICICMYIYNAFHKVGGREGCRSAKDTGTVGPSCWKQSSVWICIYSHLLRPKALSQTWTSPLFRTGENWIYFHLTSSKLLCTPRALNKYWLSWTLPCVIFFSLFFSLSPLAGSLNPWKLYIYVYIFQSLLLLFILSVFSVRPLCVLILPLYACFLCAWVLSHSFSLNLFFSVFLLWDSLFFHFPFPSLCLCLSHTHLSIYVFAPLQLSKIKNHCIS